MIDITMLDNKEKSHKELAAEWIECCIDHGVSLRSALEFVGYPAEAKGWGFVERMAVRVGAVVTAMDGEALEVEWRGDEEQAENRI